MVEITPRPEEDIVAMIGHGPVLHAILLAGQRFPPAAPVQLDAEDPRPCFRKRLPQRFRLVPFLSRFRVGDDHDHPVALPFAERLCRCHQVALGGTGGVLAIVIVERPEQRQRLVTPMFQQQSRTVPERQEIEIFRLWPDGLHESCHGAVDDGVEVRHTATLVPGHHHRARQLPNTQPVDARLHLRAVAHSGALRLDLQPGDGLAFGILQIDSKPEQGITTQDQFQQGHAIRHNDSIPVLVLAEADPARNGPVCIQTYRVIGVFLAGGHISAGMKIRQ